MRVYFLALFAMTQLYATPIIIGISGGSGSGKTTFSRQLFQAFAGKCAMVSEDCYFKDFSHMPFDQRCKLNFDDPNSLRLDQLREHILQLKNSETIERPIYNFSRHAPENGTVRVEPAELIIVDGLNILTDPGLKDLFDLKIFIDVDADVRVLRRVERDGKERARSFESVRDQYLTFVKEAHERFTETGKKNADIIVPHGGKNRKALEVIVAKLRRDLAK